MAAVKRNLAEILGFFRSA